MQHAKARFQGGQAAMSRQAEANEAPRMASVGGALGTPSPGASSSTLDNEETHEDAMHEDGDPLDEPNLDFEVKTKKKGGRRDKGKGR